MTTPLLLVTAALLPLAWGLLVSGLLVRIWPPGKASRNQPRTSSESAPFDFQI
jgi:hypothetical protein